MEDIGWLITGLKSSSIWRIMDLYLIATTYVCMGTLNLLILIHRITLKCNRVKIRMTLLSLTLRSDLKAMEWYFLRKYTNI